MVLTESNDKLKKGDLAPGFSLKATDNKIYSLNDFQNKKLYLIVFMCNHCPYVHQDLDNLNSIATDFNNVKVVGINSNESENYPEDSFENMQKEVEQGSVKFLYLHDETQEVAKAYGAVCTPDPFLFDENKKLIYKGRIKDLKEAISEYLKTEKITFPEKHSIGCSIKWK